MHPEELLTVLRGMSRPACPRERCRISPPDFLAECHKKRLNLASFVLLCFVVCFFLVFFIFVVSVLDLSSVRIFQHTPT